MKDIFEYLTKYFFLPNFINTMYNLYVLLGRVAIRVPGQIYNLASLHTMFYAKWSMPSHMDYSIIVKWLEWRTSSREVYYHEHKRHLNTVRIIWYKFLSSRD